MSRERYCFSVLLNLSYVEYCLAIFQLWINSYLISCILISIWTRVREMIIRNWGKWEVRRFYLSDIGNINNFTIAVYDEGTLPQIQCRKYSFGVWVLVHNEVHLSRLSWKQTESICKRKLGHYTCLFYKFW